MRTMTEPLTADLRVLVRMSDGRHGVYAWDGITTAGQMRKHLEEAGLIFSDPQVCDTEPPMPATVAAVFADPATQAWGQS